MTTLSSGFLVKFTRHVPYIAAGVCLVAVVGAVIVGAVVNSAVMVSVSTGILVLLLAVAASTGYRRLIKVARRTQLNSQTTLSHVAHTRLLADESLKLEGKRSAKGLGSLEWWSSSATLNSAQIVQRLTVLRSVAGRDLLAKMATDGTWTWNEVARALEAYRMGGVPQSNVMAVFESASPLRLLQLADLCFRQNCLPQDLENVASLYSIIYELDGPRQFEGKQRCEFYADSLSKTGQPVKALEILQLMEEGRVTSADQMLFEANATHPSVALGASEEAWLDSINRVYRSAGLAQLSLAPGNTPAFLRLEAKQSEPVANGPLVSVVMPVYKPDEVTDRAIQSALQQTYRNIEVIVVDDGSGGEYSERLDQWPRTDRRVTVLRSELNAGAYTSRNLGYAASKGKYLTVFDGDDWQHPQKIERLVQRAEQITDGQLVSARWTRVDEGIFFQYRGWRGAFITPAHVSALFPVKLLREKVGYWDTVRKAADTELILRYQLLVNGADPVEVSDAPLTLSLVGTANLSIDDFRLGYRAPDRIAYRESYERWHREISGGRESGYLDFPHNPRRFTAPSQFLPSRPPLPQIGVLLVGDFSETSEGYRKLKWTIKKLLEMDLVVGVLHLPSATGQFLSVGISAYLMDLVSKNKVVQVQKTDAATAGVVMITDATAFQFESYVRGAIRPQHLYVTAETPPFDEATNRHTYEVSTVSANLFSEFGIRPVWAPTTDEANEVLSRVVSVADLLPISENQEAEDPQVEVDVPANFSSEGESYVKHLWRIIGHSRRHIAKDGAK